MSGLHDSSGEGFRPPPAASGILEQIVNDSPLFVFRWRVAEGWPVEYVSGSVGRLGYSAAEFLSGAVSWTGITHPDDLPRLEAEVGEHLQHGRERFGCEYRLLTRPGEVRWMRDWNVVIRDAAGEITHIQGLILDVTAEHEAADEAAAIHHRLRRDVLEVADRERTRIGLELTEGVAQTLVGVYLGFEALEQTLRDRGVAEAQRVGDLGRFLREAIVQVRVVAASLMPVDPDREGLAASLARLATETSRNAGIRCRCEVDTAGLAIDHAMATELYEIGRDALAAAVDDGHPASASIRIGTDGATGRIEIETSGGRRPEDAGACERARLLLQYRAECIGGPLTTRRLDDGIRIECSFVNAPRPPQEPAARDA